MGTIKGQLNELMRFELVILLSQDVFLIEEISILSERLYYLIDKVPCNSKI